MQKTTPQITIKNQTTGTHNATSKSQLLYIKHLKSIIKLITSVYFFSKIQNYSSKHLLSLLNQYGTRFTYLIILILHASYINLSLEVLLFQPQLLNKYFPSIRKMFARIKGMEDFISKDQRKPCSISHQDTCVINTYNLWYTWWQAMGPSFLGSKLLYHLLINRRSLQSFNVVLSVRQLLFLFSSTGLCGGLFCVYKNCGFNKNGNGDRKGVALSSVVGAAVALRCLPTKSSLRMVTSMYWASIIAVIQNRIG